jgi:putative membrane protein
MRLLGAILGNALALLATTVVPGITFTGSLGQLVLGGVIFGLFNLIVRPIALLLSLPALILTLGLFYFVLNGILLWLAARLIPGYAVATLLAGILGSLVVTLVNWALGAVFGGSPKRG